MLIATYFTVIDISRRCFFFLFSRAYSTFFGKEVAFSTSVYDHVKIEQGLSNFSLSFKTKARSSCASIKVWESLPAWAIMATLQKLLSLFWLGIKIGDFFSGFAVIVFCALGRTMKRNSLASEKATQKDGTFGHAHFSSPSKWNGNPPRTLGKAGEFGKNAVESVACIKLPWASQKSRFHDEWYEFPKIYNEI